MIWILIVMAILITKSLSHVAVNSSDIIIVGSHADLPDSGAVFVANKPTGKTTEEVATKTTEASRRKGGDEERDDEKGDVVFMPTERDTYLARNEDLDPMHADAVRIADVMDEKRRQTTEPPQENGLIFVSGKNNDNTDRETIETRRNGNDNHVDFVIDDETETVKPKLRKPELDCTNLDCDDTIASICGKKKENGHWSNRLFLNECYFRKVNCKYKYEHNRYIKVALDNCQNAYIHTVKLKNRQQNQDRVVPVIQVRLPEKDHPKTRVTARPVPGRRAMSMDQENGWCGHVCPLGCTEDYVPVCALSSFGTRQVFVNHCKLDEHSCRYNVMWQNRPLEECVGIKRAELQANKPFISWMQRVGIVDKRGRLVTE